MLKARTPTVLDHAFTNWPLHIATPPTVDFLVEWHPAKFASPNTSVLLFNWVHGCLPVFRGYLIVYRATLLQACRSCVRSEAVFRINTFTEYKVSGLSIVRKLNLAATLWNSLNSSVVRRSSSSPTSSGGLCHLAVLRSSLIWLAWAHPRRRFRSRHTLSIGQSQGLQGAGNMLLVWLVLNSPLSMSVFCPRSSLSETVKIRRPELQLCSARMHFAETQCILSPLTSANYEKFITVHKNVGLQAFMEGKKWHGDATPRENPPASKTWA